MQALHTATISPAKSRGLDSQLGLLKAGKLADIKIVDGDITQDIYISDRVTLTMNTGRLNDADTMNEITNYDNKRENATLEK